MLQAAIIALLWFAAIGCGLLAGLYFAFSTFIMTALGRIDQVSGIMAMNAISTVIVQSLFMPLFLGTTLAGLLLAITAVFRWASRARPRCWPAGCSMSSACSCARPSSTCP